MIMTLHDCNVNNGIHVVKQNAIYIKKKSRYIKCLFKVLELISNFFPDKKKKYTYKFPLRAQYATSIYNFKGDLKYLKQRKFIGCNFLKIYESNILF